MNNKPELLPNAEVVECYSDASSIIRELVSALLIFDWRNDGMGYDPIHYFEDIPSVVEEVLESYRGLWD